MLTSKYLEGRLKPDLAIVKEERTRAGV